MNINTIFYIFLGIVLTFTSLSCESEALDSNPGELNELIEEFDLKEQTDFSGQRMKFNSVEEAREALYKLQAKMNLITKKRLKNYTPSSFVNSKSENDDPLPNCTVSQHGDVLIFDFGIFGSISFKITLNKNDPNAISSYFTGENASLVGYTHQNGSSQKNGSVYTVHTVGTMVEHFEVLGDPYTYTQQSQTTTTYNESTGYCYMENDSN